MDGSSPTGDGDLFAPFASELDWCIAEWVSLWEDPLLADHLIYQPKSIFQDVEKKKRSYSEMWTEKWWQFTQDKLPTGATAAPLIIATNKTQLTQFSGSKQAYPVYITLGNIPRSLRRKPSQQACILLGYLPVEKISKESLNKQEHSAHYLCLFHEAMHHVGRRVLRWPVQMALSVVYIADFPEQCLVTCSKYGTCLKCPVSADHLGDPLPAGAHCQTNAWTLGVMQEACRTTSSYSQYFKACMKEEVSGYVQRPFWMNFPFPTYISLYQCVLKHLIAWCQDVLGKDELDRRICCLPPAFGVRHFKNGLSSLSQIIRAILDFIYLAQYATHDDDTLSHMDNALSTWHKYKDCFIDLNIQNNLNMPKFHSLEHYVEMICFLGTTDNFNTEMFKCLHIDFATKGWRASNKHNKFPQMTHWLSCQENIKLNNRL
ncbi:hypothetical protein BT96DRAFT_958038 [Gymnopus androsaceus JB14]|uniref:CxC2-like cysteine cluster KDZ transposase-associated domain-containing protein n=1 Tax=Gymnopus androsaceus JB14 TaxID=1447944 RepID=A0A6A4HIR9_9AGAR|nr:hypothetical protein BT96DRAFT_958038 [Gymnopus androsaceus JB14]